MTWCIPAPTVRPSSHLARLQEGRARRKFGLPLLQRTGRSYPHGSDEGWVFTVAAADKQSGRAVQQPRCPPTAPHSHSRLRDAAPARVVRRVRQGAAVHVHALPRLAVRQAVVHLRATRRGTSLQCCTLAPSSQTRLVHDATLERRRGTNACNKVNVKGRRLAGGPREDRHVGLGIHCRGSGGEERPIVRRRGAVVFLGEPPMDAKFQKERFSTHCCPARGRRCL